MENEQSSTNDGLAVQAVDFTAYLTDEQLGAIRAKAGAVKTDWVKESGLDTDNSVLAYFVCKARKEADDAIFSASRQGLYFELLRWYSSFVSESKDVVRLAENSVSKVMETCGQDIGRLKTLAGMLRKELLAGRFAIPAEKLEAFKTCCDYMGVDPESLK